LSNSSQNSSANKQIHHPLDNIKKFQNLVFSSSSSSSFEDLEEDQGDNAQFKLTQEQPPLSSFSRLHPEEEKRK
jgi:hypothetical protein